MRMWMVKPELMCRQHLVGEHKELHMLAGTIERANQTKHKKCLETLTSINCLEVSSLYERYGAIKQEMLSRGYKDNKDLQEVDFSPLSDFVMSYKVDVDSSYQDLINRCPHCRSKISGA